jgi:hypothetical protein
LRGDNVDAKSWFATWEFGFAVKTLTLRAEKEELVVEAFRIFKDKSGRPNYRVVEKFKRK